MEKKDYDATSEFIKSARETREANEQKALQKEKLAYKKQIKILVYGAIASLIVGIIIYIITLITNYQLTGKI